MSRLITLLLSAFVSAFLVSPVSALTVWTEVGDAGELPMTAQLTGGEELLTIFGSISNFQDSDLYCIHITDPTDFSVETFFSGDSEVQDTQLTLFDENGKGLAASDDMSDTDLFSRITSADTPVGPGIYLLGISAFDRDPMSPGGYIFPNTKFVGVQGPTGPGGAGLLTRWSNTGFETGGYQIELRGVAGCVSEPSIVPAFAVVITIGCIFQHRRLRRRGGMQKTVERRR
jgi:hypothetical protein